MRTLGISLSLIVFPLIIACNGPAPTPQAVATAAAPAVAAEKGGQEEFGPYELVENWPQPLPDGPDGVKHEGWTWGSVGAVYAETPDRIWIAQRGELPLPKDAKPWTPYWMLSPSRGNATGNTDGLSATCESTPKRGWERRWHHTVFIVDRNGKMVGEWPHLDKMFSQDPCGRGPHKIKMNPYDPEKHVWIIDDQQHLIWKFTYDGKLVMTLGTVGKRGRDAGKLFDRPTDIDWLPDGTFFISDGYGGARVAKFDKDGKFLMDWGTPPKDPKNPGPNEFNTVHSIQISKDGRLFVVDRGHRRIQVFDQTASSSTCGRPGVLVPYAHIITTDQSLWIAGWRDESRREVRSRWTYLYGWGGPGGQPGQFNGPHSITVDQEGNLYLAEVFNGRVQKFHPKAGADPAKLVGTEHRYSASATN